MEEGWGGEGWKWGGVGLWDGVGFIYRDVGSFEAPPMHLF